VLDVQPKLAARVRLLAAGNINKNDPNDARSVAVAALRSAEVREARRDDHAAVLKIWSKRYGDLGRARRQQLLGQQMPHPARAFDRPGALRPGLRPRQQPLRLGGAGPYLQLAQRHLRRVDRHRSVRGLVRVDPNHHRHHGNALLPVLDLG